MQVPETDVTWTYSLLTASESRASARTATPMQNAAELVGKAAQYAKAEASRVIQGPVSLEVIGQRKAACDGCEGCDKRAEGEWYCDRCGCPKWKRSQLQVKWEMPAATCPLGKWPQVG